MGIQFKLARSPRERRFIDEAFSLIHSLILVSLAIILTVILRLDDGYAEAQARKNAQETELEKLWRELMEPPPEVLEKQKRSVYLGGHGAIDWMALPGDWVEGRSDIGIFHYTIEFRGYGPWFLVGTKVEGIMSWTYGYEWTGWYLGPFGGLSKYYYDW